VKIWPSFVERISSPNGYFPLDHQFTSQLVIIATDGMARSGNLW